MWRGLILGVSLLFSLAAQSADRLPGVELVLDDPDLTAAPLAAAAAPDGALIVAAATSGQEQHPIILRIDPLGETKWKSVLTDRTAEGAALTLAANAQGTVFIAVSDPAAATLSRLDDKGKPVWTSKLTGHGDETIRALLADDTGGVFVASEATNLPQKTGGADMALLLYHYTADGKKLWEKVLNGGRFGAIRVMVARGKGALMIGGDQWENIGTGGKTEPVPFPWYATVSIADGAVINEIRLRDRPGRAIYGLSPADDGGLVLAIWDGLTSADGGRRNSATEIVKFDQTGRVSWQADVDNGQFQSFPIGVAALEGGGVLAFGGDAQMWLVRYERSGRIESRRNEKSLGFATASSFVTWPDGTAGLVGRTSETSTSDAYPWVLRVTVGAKPVLR